MDTYIDYRAQARKVALYVLHLWDAPAVVKEYLETDNEDLRDKAFGESKLHANHMEKTAWGQCAARASMWACGVTEFTALRESLNYAASALREMDETGLIKLAELEVRKAKAELKRAEILMNEIEQKTEAIRLKVYIQAHDQIVRELNIKVKNHE